MKCQALLSLKNKKKIFIISAAFVIDALTFCMLGNFACFFVVC